MRGQVTLEAILVTGVAILIILSLTSLGLERVDMARETGGAGEARMIGEMLASAINNAYANGEGFSVQLSGSELNYSRFTSIVLPIRVSTSARAIVISKNTTYTTQQQWNTSIAIIPANISRKDPRLSFNGTTVNATETYNETTFRNNGTHIIIYATSDHISVG